jgi:hypothetical protein
MITIVRDTLHKTRLIAETSCIDRSLTIEIRVFNNRLSIFE